MPGSGAITTSRESSVRIVGALSGVPPGFLPPPNIEQAPSDVARAASASARTSGARRRRCGSGLDRMVALLTVGGAVVQLRDGVARLRRVGGQAFLLRL